MFSARLRAVSPVIAMIVIVAITLSIAFAVVGWLFGLWGSLAGGTPQITITNVDGYIKDNNIVIRVYMMNKGTAGDEILGVRIVHAGEEAECVVIGGNDETFNAIKGYGGWGYDSQLTANVINVINAGYKGWLTIVCNKNGQVGDSFMVKFFFKNSGVITVSGVISKQEGERTQETPIRAD